MGISNSIKKATGILTVQVEGFFTERFINLCKINNVKIWDIRQIVEGVIRFKIYISDFKKLKPIAKKTKCRVKIKDKKGIYFKFFKYRKKRVFIALFIILIIFSIVFSSFVWKINVTGNSAVSKEQIIEELKNSGLYVGRSKIGLSKGEIINSLRAKIPDLSWAGISINGTNANIEVVEKVVVADKDKLNINIPGNIIADKSGVVTKIIAENGTAKYKEGSYIEENYVLIEGIITSKVMDPVYVHAKGLIRVNNEYIFDKEYKYETVIKEYTNSNRYAIGISVNNKENMLNYLNKNKKYDITKSSKNIKIFGKEISFDLYKCEQYIEKQVKYTKDDLLYTANVDARNFIDKIILTLKNASYVKEQDQVIDTGEGIKYIKTYTINEEIGKFVERSN
ncbi:MAG: sporulation protein YqfD [Clostridia bacterium]|nr:sporulation protein YqfD [Clostridia bacterium]